MTRRRKVVWQGRVARIVGRTLCQPLLLDLEICGVVYRHIPASEVTGW